jgi:RNA polymerase sigma-70 factor (ECF subfamily)
VGETFEEQVRASLEGRRFDEAAAATIRGYGPEILGYLTSVLRDGDDADDAFAQFAENLWATLHQFRGECSLRAWCYRLAWHEAAHVLREPYRRRRALLPTSEAQRLAQSVRSSTPLDQGSAAREWLERVRASLTAADHTLLVLRFDRDLSWREVAEVLATDGEPLDEPVVRKRYQRLKDRLRELAVEEGLIPE